MKTLTVIFALVTTILAGCGTFNNIDKDHNKQCKENCNVVDQTTSTEPPTVIVQPAQPVVVRSGGNFDIGAMIAAHRSKVALAHLHVALINTQLGDVLTAKAFDHSKTRRMLKKQLGKEATKKIAAEGIQYETPILERLNNLSAAEAYGLLTNPHFKNRYPILHEAVSLRLRKIAGVE